MKKLEVWFDGASRGNPGAAGAGVVIKDDQGRIVREIYKYLGKKTNNIAEYSGLYIGLLEASRLGATHLDIYSDSQLVISQMKGAWKVRNPKIGDAYAACRGLVHRFEQVSFHHVPRAENSRADRLANMALDKHYSEQEKG